MSSHRKWNFILFLYGRLCRAAPVYAILRDVDSQSNHEIIVRFWITTTASLFFIAVALVYGRKLEFSLFVFALAIISLYREWLAENNGTDAKTTMKDFLEHVGLIAFVSLFGMFTIIAFPYFLYTYIKARRSPYY